MISDLHPRRGLELTPDTERSSVDTNTVLSLGPSRRRDPDSTEYYYGDIVLPSVVHVDEFGGIYEAWDIAHNGKFSYCHGSCSL